jgi:2-polyprenyl-3-methyl-5-hydroxy-6-metoxy-1,4-benzoquinol methylase
MITPKETDMKPAAAADIEKVRAYWNARPCNLRHSRHPVGTREYFDQVEARKYFVEPHIPGFAGFPKWKGKKVLEIGCGLGTDAVNFVRAGADYTAIEVSEQSLELAKKRFAVYGLKGTFHLGNAEEMTSVIPAQPFDLIYSFGVIHHTPNPERVVAAVKKFMTADSEFRLMMYARNSWKQFMIEAGYDQPEAQSGCPVAFTYTADELRQLLGGFEILEMRQEHIFPYIVEKYVKYEYEKLPWWQAMPEDLFRILEKKLGWHLLTRCRLAGSVKVKGGKP